ncbi:MAG: hypothetical protein ABSE27_09385 [Acidobacteriaceae bacterium]
MNIELNYEQSARIELLSLYAGKPSSQLLLDAAMLLLDRDAGCCERCRQAGAQEFLDEEQVEARFAQLLHR